MATPLLSDIRQLLLRKRKKGYKTMIMFGDGATDLDARSNGPASAFIGYGTFAHWSVHGEIHVLWLYAPHAQMKHHVAC